MAKENRKGRGQMGMNEMTETKKKDIKSRRRKRISRRKINRREIRRRKRMILKGGRKPSEDKKKSFGVFYTFS